MFVKPLCLCLLVVFSAIGSLTACGPAQTNLANPTVPGDHSTISGDRGATAEQRSLAY